jgi:hypothetical protein
MTHLQFRKGLVCDLFLAVEDVAINKKEIQQGSPSPISSQLYHTEIKHMKH